MRRPALLAVLLLSSIASAAPVITSITPTEGTEYGGTTIRIHGTGFKITSEILIDGAVPAAQAWLGSSTELEALTRAHAPGGVSVTVRQDDGEFTLANAFTYVKDPYAMTPQSGPASGGTLVTIKGQFDPTTYDVYFGDQRALGTWRVSNDTLLAVAPPKCGPLSFAQIRFFVYDYGVSTNLYFTYEDAPERILLPLLIAPASGAFGSRFVTELRACNRSASQTARIFGLSYACHAQVCPPVVPDPARDSITVAPQTATSPPDVVYNGTPGRFAYMAKDQVDHLWLNLRVFDESRSGQNFGTELPVVRDRDLFRYEPIVFTDVPTDPRFRNTLRIYAESAVTLHIEMTNGSDYSSTRDVTLQPSQNKFDPAYAQIGDLPVGVGPIRIRIVPPEPGQPGFYTATWALISVTNNDTQLITTIHP